MEQPAIEAGGHLGHRHAVHGAEQVAQPVRLGEQQQLGQSAIGEQRAIGARGCGRGEQRLVILHVVGAHDLGTLAGDARKQVDGGVLGGDHHAGIADGGE